ncbi:MAG: 1-deoxy-D-xylulose-5-phosphate reductoisomerase, partial [Alistipes sp.]|nr:1-deoxy-D-xylulose-5-phosphate reductoisomerase [Alistipes sp.]
FEVVEARWLFGLAPEQIDVLIHPASIVHSMVEFADGAIKAQMGTPDMRVPIAYALSFPERLPLPEGFGRLEIEQQTPLSFAHVEQERYPALSLVGECMAAGGTALCAFNAANEVAVEAFLAGRIAFTDMVKVIGSALQTIPENAKPTLEEYMECNTRTKADARKFITHIIRN